MTQKEKEKVAKLMKNLDLTEAEAIEVMEADKQIDKGAKLFELTEEQEKASKTARKAGKGVEQKERKPREKKADDVKKDLIAEMVNGVKRVGGSVEIVNDEREFLFTYNDKKYKVVMSCPRK
jgi:hypothetical protein